MRQLFSRVFDVAVGAACALLVIGSAGTVEDAVPPTMAARSILVPTLADVYAGSTMSAPELRLVSDAPVDPKAPWLATVVAAGRHARLETTRGPVHVFTPAGYTAATAMTIVYVHGYHQDADTVWAEHRLPEQFALSGINALFVVPEAPIGKRDAIAWRSASAVLGEVEQALAEPLPRKVAVIGHSGAYRTIIQWLADRRVDSIVLLDAAYVDVRPYRAWVVRSKRHRFLNVSIDTVRWSDRLHRTLPSTKIIDGFPQEITDELRAARILYIRSDIGHWPLVTEGVALPAMVRALHGVQVLEELPPLGLPPEPAEPAHVQSAQLDAEIAK
ncbi:MAG: hypothetical protein H0T89_08750 [Deltaproteobacteria bacterium]|nr:hypothetical protein [Deltaproteobacteria bacterium]MDQ3299999.1 hypothetical protein [Myxococcota bacterium]